MRGICREAGAPGPSSPVEQTASPVVPRAARDLALGMRAVRCLWQRSHLRIVGRLPTSDSCISFHSERVHEQSKGRFPGHVYQVAFATSTILSFPIACSA